MDLIVSPSFLITTKTFGLEKLRSIKRSDIYHTNRLTHNKTCEHELIYFILNQT